MCEESPNFKLPVNTFTSHNSFLLNMGSENVTNKSAKVCKLLKSILKS